MTKRLSEKIYSRAVRKHPAAMKMYARYKIYNADYHRENRLSSLAYLLRLIIADARGKSLHMVQMPSASVRPFSIESHSTAFSRTPCKAVSDTMLADRKSVFELADALEEYDTVSFDVFDTLIFRPFSSPSDMFYLLGTRLSCFDFRNLRIDAETWARHNTSKPNFEVNIYDIYERLAKISPLSPEDAESEIALELELCYPNPYMQELFGILRQRNKRIIAISDMYLPSAVIEKLLRKNGYDGIEKLYVSCEYGYNKSSGKLFSYAKRDFGDSIIHIGDSHDADVRGASMAKLSAYHYVQCNEFGNRRRPPSLISPTSAVYKGIVNNFVYNGHSGLTAREAFGFIYAAPVTVGFCDFINSFCESRGLEKILFLARDMYIFRKIYNRHFGKFDNEYAAASRFALQELIVADYPLEYFRHTVRARCDRGYTVKRALSEINLDFLASECPRFGINERDIIVSSKLSSLERMFVENRERIAEHFSDNERAARAYFEQKLAGARRICVADLGWRGSILAYLKFLLIEKWKLCDEVYGVLVASTVNDTSVELISDATVTSYAYDHTHNRDFLSGGDWETEYIRILALESVFTSEEGSLLEYRLTEEGGCRLVTCDKNRNAPIVREFARGIELFADAFESFRRKYSDAYPITAVDAFEPIRYISANYEYMARIIGDVVDTPYAIAGFGINDADYVPLGELMRERNMIKEWPIK